MTWFCPIVRRVDFFDRRRFGVLRLDLSDFRFGIFARQSKAKPGDEGDDDRGRLEGGIILERGGGELAQTDRPTAQERRDLPEVGRGND